MKKNVKVAHYFMVLINVAFELPVRRGKQLPDEGDPFFETRRGNQSNMSKKIYAYVGNWSFEPKPAKGKGISIFRYDAGWLLRPGVMVLLILTALAVARPIITAWEKLIGSTPPLVLM